MSHEEDGPRTNIWGTTVSVHETQRRFKIFLENFQVASRPPSSRTVSRLILACGMGVLG